MKILFLSLLIALPTGVAQAGDPVPADVDQDQTTQIAQSELTERDSRRNCMRYTGSRIVQSRTERAKRASRGDDAERDKGDQPVASLEPDSCVSANGRVYSRSDLQRTGEIDLADALRKLDPAIR